MDFPTMLSPIPVARDTHALPAYVPVPGLGVLPVNAFVIRGAEPVLVDTGIGALSGALLSSVASVLPPEELRWIWLTHVDADHVGALEPVLAAAPRARVVTTFLGMGKLGLQRPVPPERIHLLNPGQRLELGDRALVALRPPSFDAPETTGFLDTRTRALFSSDCFGAVLSAPAESARDVGEGALRDGVVTWATVDAPWLHGVDPAAFGATLQEVVSLDPSVVLSSHLPPAPGMTGTLVRHLGAARTAPPFVGPDQRALVAMLGAA